MKNNTLSINFNETTGYINEIHIINDSTRMNFIKPNMDMGKILLNAINENTWCFEPTAFNLISFTENGDQADAIFNLQGLQLNIHYSLTETCLNVKYLIKNNNPFPYYFKDADIKILIPFNDVFVSSEYCKNNACNQGPLEPDLICACALLLTVEGLVTTCDCSGKSLISRLLEYNRYDNECSGKKQYSQKNEFQYHFVIFLSI